MQLDVYLAVEDLERSATFYAQVLGVQPVDRSATYVAFPVGANRLGLMAAAGYAVPVQRGNSAVPTLKVNDLDTWHAKIQPLAT